MTNWLRKPWAFFLFLALGIAVTVVLKKTQPQMERIDSGPQGVAAGTIQLQQHPVRPTVVGYGEVKPDLLLDIRAEVSGRISYIHPDLKEGAILPKDTLVLRIDDKDYQLAITQARARLAQSRNSLTELELQLKNSRIDLKLVQQKLALSKKEYARKQSLRKRQTLSQSALEQARVEVIQLQQEVQSLNSKLDSLPLQIDQQQAQIEISQAELDTQLRNLERTEIRLPIDTRITQVKTETDSFVATGAELFYAQNIDRVQINVQLPVQEFGLLVAGGIPRSVSIQQILTKGSDIWQQLAEQLNLNVSVQLAGDGRARWQGRVVRTDSNLDPQARTLGVIVMVDNPYEDIQPGIRPPLLEGMFTKVTLQGPPAPYVVIPKTALHEGELYQVNAEQQLQRLPVQGHSQNSMLLVPDPSLAGQTIVSSDIFPAVSGMKLIPYADTDTAGRVTRWLQDNGVTEAN